MECDKYDIFINEIERTANNNDFQQVYSISNLILLMVILFLLMHLFWGIQNQLNSNKLISDFNSSQWNSENFKTEEYANLQKNFENDALTKENTSFNKYVGLNSWVMNEEINNIIEEKNWNISYYLQNYAFSTSHKSKLWFGPNLNNEISKSHNITWNDANWNSSSKFDSPSLQSTDYSENMSPPKNINNKQDDKITKRVKRVRFEFPQRNSTW